ncbi:MAG: ABC transporter substrate-binding protein [Chloroflexota bacterium]
MKTRNPLLLVVCLTVLGLVLASCAPAAAPTPTPKPAPAPEKPAPAATKPAAQPTTPAAAPKPAAPTPKPAAPSPTPKPSAEQPRSGGILDTTLNSDMPSFDVQQETGLLTHSTVQSCYNGLLQFQPSEPDKVISDLAEKWEASSDGTVYTFHLHKGVKFHDGSTLTSEDAKFSLDRVYNPPKGIRSPRMGSVASIEKVEAPDENTVKITLKYPQSSIVSMLAVNQIAIYPKKVVEAKGDMKKTIVGSGPFMYKDYSLGTLFEVKKNPNYFIKGRPYLDGLRFYVIKDPSTMLAAFRTGKVKLMDPTLPAGLRPAHARQIGEEMKQAVVVSYPSISARWLNMVVTKEPFTDVRVRRAVHLAVDRQAAVKVLLEGIGDIGTNFVPGSVWGLPEAERLKLPGFRQPKDADIAEAKKLLAEAGFPNGFKTKILARTKYTDDMAVLMKEQLAKIGVELEIDVQESAVFLDWIYKHTHAMVAQPIGVRLSDPDEFARYFQAGGGQSQTELDDAEVNKLFDEQRRAQDPAERLKIARRLEMRLLEVAASAPLYWAGSNIAHLPEVKDYYRGAPYCTNKYQDVWLAK